MRLSPLILLVALPLSADALGDLKAALLRLKGSDPIAATAEVQTWSKGSGKEAKPKQGKTSTRIEQGPQGLRLGWTGEQVAQALEARRKKTGDASDPLSAPEAWRILNAAEDLLLELEKAKVKAETVEPWHDQPARKLVLGLDLDLDAESKEHLKQADRTATIWLATDGTPYAEVIQMDMKGRVLLISFKVHETTRREFRHIGNRLVVVREEKEQRAAGMGQGGESRTVLTVTLP